MTGKHPPYDFQARPDTDIIEFVTEHHSTEIASVAIRRLRFWEWPRFNSAGVRADGPNTPVIVCIGFTATLTPAERSQYLAQLASVL